MEHETGSVRLYWRLTAGHRRRYALGVLALVGVNVLSLFPPLALGMLVDSLSGRGPRHSPALVAIAYVGAVLAQSLVRYPMRKGFAGTAALIVAELRARYAHHLLAVSPQSLLGHSTGELLSRATSDLSSVETMLSSGLHFVFDSVFYLAALPVAMILLSPQLFAYALLPLPFIPLLAGFLVRRISEKTALAQQAFGRLAQKGHENAASIQTVRAYGLEAREGEEFRTRSEECGSKDRALGRLEAGFSPAIQVLMALGMFAVLLAGGSGAALGRLSTGKFLALLQYYAMLAWPLMALSWAFLYARKGEVGLRRVHDILGLPAADPVRGEAVPATLGTIEVRNLTYRYPGASRPALEDISFSVRPGERVAILGPTGSGKSTLIRLLTRLLEAPPGSIWMDEHDVRELRARDLRAQVAVAPQEPFLFAGSIRENIRTGIPSGAGPSGSVEAAWEAAGLVRDHLPDGPDTTTSARGANLSGGQRQRVSIARALVRGSPVLILDDALSALDAETEEGIFRELSSESRRSTLLLVTHRVYRVRSADRILVLDQGRLVEEGSHEELQRAGGHYAALLRHTDPFDESNTPSRPV